MEAIVYHKQGNGEYVKVAKVELDPEALEKSLTGDLSGLQADADLVVGAVQELALEEAFRLTNHIDHDYASNKEVTLFPGFAGGARSTSCGDIVVLDGKAYVVATMGFEEVHSAPIGFGGAADVKVVE